MSCAGRKCVAVWAICCSTSMFARHIQTKSIKFSIHIWGKFSFECQNYFRLFVCHMSGRSFKLIVILIVISWCHQTILDFVVFPGYSWNLKIVSINPDKSSPKIKKPRKNYFGKCSVLLSTWIFNCWMEKVYFVSSIGQRFLPHLLWSCVEFPILRKTILHKLRGHAPKSISRKHSRMFSASHIFEFFSKLENYSGLRNEFSVVYRDRAVSVESGRTLPL